MPDLFRGIRIALADLRHEWVLTLCIVLAIATAMAPLVIVLGLKEGVVTTLRERLVEDPANRELTPRLTRPYAEDFFTAFEARDDVAFITPSILSGASVLSARLPSDGDGRGELVNFGLKPTGEGDPLLVDNGVAVPPADGEIVLSSAAAARLTAAAGDTVTFQVFRSGRGQPVDLDVVAVLPDRAGDAETAFVPYAFIEDVERYKLGFGVPERGWSGADPQPGHAYEALLAIAPRRLSRSDLARLKVGVGVTDVVETSAEEIGTYLSLTPVDGQSYYLMTTIGKPVTPSTLRRARDRLRAEGAVILPLITPLELGLVSDRGEVTVTAQFYSADSTQSTRSGWPATPWGSYRRDEGLPRPLSVAGASDGLTGLALPPRLVTSTDAPVIDARAADDDALAAAFGVEDGFAIVPTELGAVLVAAREAPLGLAVDGNLEAGPPQPRSFRLYARSIDDVLALEQDLDAQGVPTFTRGRDIARVRELDTALTSIFWILAVVGGLGATAALGANMYASVQRKTRDYGVLRLMGLSRGALVAVPLTQAVLISFSGAVVALLAYWGFARIGQAVFAERIAIGDTLTRLPIVYALATIMIAVLAGLVSAFVAAKRATGIDPAEAIRVE